MHFLSPFTDYWWAILLVMLGIVGGFVLVAGRGAEGGFRARTASGWGRWRQMSRQAAELQARILLTVIYFSLVVPFGLLRTHFADPLRARPANRPRAWLERQTRDRSLDDAQRQF